MTFAELVSGDSVFIDANTFVYHFQPHPTFGFACNQLISRIENQDLIGLTATHVLTEVAHRLMILEAAAAFGWGPSKVKQRLRSQRPALRNLKQFRNAVATLLGSQIQVITIAPALVLAATDVSQNNGLLSNDALIVAAMQANNLTKLASSDLDFDGVSGIMRYGPL